MPAPMLRHAAAMLRPCCAHALHASGVVRVAALQLMSAVLSWDFARGGGSASNGGFGYVPESMRKESDSSRVTPGPAWRATLLSEGVFDWLFALHAAAKAQPTPGSAPIGAVRRCRLTTG